MFVVIDDVDRWKIEFGKAWQHLGGDLVGQTQVSYGKYSIQEDLVLSHPVDAHFAATGLQVSFLRLSNSKPSHYRIRIVGLGSSSHHNTILSS